MNYGVNCEIRLHAKPFKIFAEKAEDRNIQGKNIFQFFSITFISRHDKELRKKYFFID